MITNKFKAGMGYSLIFRYFGKALNIPKHYEEITSILYHTTFHRENLSELNSKLISAGYTPEQLTNLDNMLCSGDIDSILLALETIQQVLKY